MMTAPNPIADTSTAADLRCALARALPPAAGGRIRAGRSASAPGAPRTPCRPDSSTRPASPPPPSSATPRSPPPSSPPGQCLPQRAVVVPPRAVDSPSHSAAPSTCPAARKRWSTTPVCGRPRRRRLADGRLSRSGWHGSASDCSSSANEDGADRLHHSILDLAHADHALAGRLHLVPGHEDACDLALLLVEVDERLVQDVKRKVVEQRTCCSATSAPPWQMRPRR
mmetsp:Transcript_35576/g.71290  ORF Transcript_35576/g.71290 Transcript_35576/m.71290 type:complete len:226 (-) Transcript_35576:1560-2237(-)